MNNTYCTFPFKQVAVKKIKRGKIIQYAPCCHIKPSARLKMPNDDPTPDELFNSPEMKQLRSDLLAGIKNPTCDACWKREARGQRSFRITTPYQPEAELNTLDLTMSNSCNLMCRMCTPTKSNKLMIDQKKWKDASVDFEWMKPFWWDSTPHYTEKTKFYEYLMAHTEQFTTLKIIGGEPFYDKHCLAVYEKYVEMGTAKNTVLWTNTNGLCFSDKVCNMINEFKTAKVTISCDGTGKVYDYVRHGSTWQEFQDNMNNYKKLVKNRKKKVTIAFTMQVYNLSNMQDTCEYVDSIDGELLPYPVFPDTRGIYPWYLPVDYLKKCKEKVTHQSEAGDEMRRYFDYWIKENKEDLKLVKREIVLFDKSRDQHYADYLDPELTTLLDSVNETAAA